MVSAPTVTMEAYRVTKSFQWDGWFFAPNTECRCPCRQYPGDACLGHNAAGCKCHDTSCHCDCGIPPKQYGGDIWLVQPGNPRKESMLMRRYAVYDASLPPISEIMNQEKYQKLLKPWIAEATTPTPAPARRSKGQ